MVFGLPWGLYVPNLVHEGPRANISSDIKQKTFQMILNALCDLENKVKVMWFNLGLRLAMVPACTKFSQTSSNISPDIERKPF